jgi:hypothetical protein
MISSPIDGKRSWVDRTRRIRGRVATAAPARFTSPKVNRRELADYRRRRHVIDLMSRRPYL